MTNPVEADRDTWPVATRHHNLPADGRPAEMVPISALLLSDSPRLEGENIEHSQTLAESGAALPPIVVHRATMRVLDGMHRVSAAMLRGEGHIAVRYFDGDEKDAFVLAVRANIAHGLPLSLADRTTAAARIINSHAQWSDRAIAAATGLSHKTVASIRRRTGGDVLQLRRRAGLDGRTRLLVTAEGRKAAAALIAEKPTASLREIARTTGISMGTARDVRARLQRGEDPVLPGRRHDRTQQGEPDRPAADGQALRERDATAQALTRMLRPRSVVEHPEQAPVPGCSAVIERLRRDPSLRFSESGRSLLRLLDRSTMDSKGLMSLIGIVPAHWTTVVAAMAREYADSWCQFADQLEDTAARQS